MQLFLLTSSLLRVSCALAFLGKSKIVRLSSDGNYNFTAYTYKGMKFGASNYYHDDNWIIIYE